MKNIMKIFAIYSKVELDIAPSWLNDFRKKYDEPWDLHITYKQPAWIDETELVIVKEKLSDVCSGMGSIKVEFDKIVTDKDEDGKYCIMIKARENQGLNTLQEMIVKGLTDRFVFREEKTRSYELNFMSHITIGRDVEEKDWLKYKPILENDCYTEGKVSEVILSVVDEVSIEEAKKEKNMFIYKI